MSEEPTPVQKFMSSPYVFEEYELPYDYDSCVVINKLETSDTNTEMFSALVKKIYGITKNVEVVTTNDDAQYEVMAQVCNVLGGENNAAKANLVLGFISEKVARTQQAGNKFNKKKGVRAEYSVAGDAYVFAYCIKSTGTGNDAVSTPYLKAWRVQKNALSGMTVFNGSAYLGTVAENASPVKDNFILGWFDKDDFHYFLVTKSSSLLEGMHKDILPGTYMPASNSFDAIDAAYKLQLKISN